MANANIGAYTKLRAEALTGPQKVAVLLMSLGTEAASAISKNLSEVELEQISLEIARLEHVSGDVAQAVLDEWMEMQEAAHLLAEGGVEYAKQILEKTLGPQKAAAVLEKIESQLNDTNGLYSLRHADPQQLTSVLRNEPPQTIALILAQLDARQTAAVIDEIDPLLASEVLFRMARMEKVLPEVMEAVDASLGMESDLSISQDMSAAGGPEAVAEVLNRLAGSLEKDLLDRIAQQDEELCEQIKNLMFVFEDIVDIDDRGIQRITQEVDTKKLALALKAASENLKERITSTMSQRARDALEEEMEFLGPVRLREVEEAQAEIVATARRLEEEGEIVINTGQDDVIIE